MEALEKGKLYQVRNYREGWVIAEYRGKVERGRVTGYRSTDGATEWIEPAHHYLNYVTGGDIRIYDKDFQVRPVTEDTLAEIERLKAKAASLKVERQATLKELRELTQ